MTSVVSLHVSRSNTGPRSFGISSSRNRNERVSPTCIACAFSRARSRRRSLLSLFQRGVNIEIPHDGKVYRRSRSLRHMDLSDVKRAEVPPVPSKRARDGRTEGGRASERPDGRRVEARGQIVFKGLNRLSLRSWRPYSPAGSRFAAPRGRPNAA